MGSKLISGGNFDFDSPNLKELGDTESTSEFKGALRRHTEFRKKHPIQYFFKRNIKYIMVAVLIFLTIFTLFLYA